MIKTLSSVLCTAVLLVWALPLSAATLTEQIQDRYESIDSFTTEFTQELTNASSREREVRQGQISFKQPRLIRWETTVPEAELLIVGPDTVWNYFPAEESVYTYPVEQIFDSKTMLRFISGRANLEEDFFVESQEMEEGFQKLKLVPRKPEPNLVLAYLWVDPETALLHQILLVDFFGNGNQLTFDDLELNIDLSEDLFSFSPPQGVEILEN
ncbi:MAG: outer membrane lipoprotein chaperone LolA [Desulfovibrionales bacterium]